MILFTSDIEQTRRACEKTAFVYLLLSILCALFGAVYELFSHGVYSYFMLYAFAYPLVGGVLPFFARAFFGRRHHPGTVTRCMHHAGIATLTVGSIVKGILQIYGTTNRLCSIYFIVGILMLLLAIASNLIALPRRR